MMLSLFRLSGLVTAGTVLTCALLASSPAVAARGSDPVAEPTVENARPAERSAVPVDGDAPNTTSSRGARGDRSAMTLDAITIEGEIDVPQVLFITARDHLRRLDPLHRLYLAGPATLVAIPVHGSGIAVPVWRALHDGTAHPSFDETIIRHQPEE